MEKYKLQYTSIEFQKSFYNYYSYLIFQNVDLYDNYLACEFLQNQRASKKGVLIRMCPIELDPLFKWNNLNIL